MAGDVDVDPTLPEFVREMLASGASLEPIRLDGKGRWWHRGNPIEHARIASLFSRSVARTDGGTWVLQVGRFTYPIEVADTPLFVRRLRSDRDAFAVSLSDGSTERIQLVALAERLRWDDRGLVVEMPSGFGARVLPPDYVDFATEYVVAEGAGFAVCTGEATVPLERWTGRA